MSLPRFENYKDSGIDWLRSVPSHWELKRLRFVAELNPSKRETATLDPETPVSFLPMEAIGDDGTINAEEIRPLSSVTTGYTYFREGDVTIAKITPCFENGKGAVMRGLVGGFGFGTTELIVVRPVSPHTTGSYLHWLFSSTQFRKRGEGSMYGAGGQKRVPDEFVRNFAIAFPPPEEQFRLCTFLDHETTKIDALIAEQQRLIELLREKRQAVISHAVTKGLNPAAPMKPSGIEWLGDIPAHWEVLPLGRITVDKCDGPFGSGLKSEHYTESGVRVIRLQNIRERAFDNRDEAYIDEGYGLTELAGHDVVAGDVLIAGLGDDRNTVGRACVAPPALEPAMVKADCFRFRLDRDRAQPEFVASQLSASASYDAGILSSGSTRSRIALSVMASRRLVLPPLPEQELITVFLDRQCGTLDALTAEAQSAITLLQERRTALISAAVTGKIDVRSLGSIW